MITITLNPQDQQDRLTLSTTIERLIDMLDQMDPDPDLEDGLDAEPGSWAEGPGKVRDTGSDENLEPSLGAPDRYPGSFASPSGRSGVLHVENGGRNSQAKWADGGSDDREHENEREPQHDEELSSGWGNEGSQQVLTADDDGEPDLGWTEHIDQVRRNETANVFLGDSEPDLGWAESHGKGIVGEQNCIDDREHEDEREKDDAERGIADADALHEVYGDHPFDGWTGDGSGHKIAARQLKMLAVPSSGERAGEIIAERDAARTHRAIALPLAGGIPQLRASDFDRLPWAD